MRNRNLITEEERMRILQMHKDATKKQYLKETMDMPLDMDLAQLEKEVKDISKQVQVPENVVAGSVCYAENPKEIANIQKLNEKDKSTFEKVMDFFANKSFQEKMKVIKNLISEIKKKKSGQKGNNVSEQLEFLSIMIPGVGVTVGVALAVLIVLGLITSLFTGKSGGSSGSNWACRNKSAVHNWVRRGF